MDNEDSYLKNARGVIHVGANSGQERETYHRLGLRVFWVEAIPTVFQNLEENIRGYPNQRAALALLADVDGQAYEFNIASNEGASSSIYDFGQHKDIWPQVTYVGKLRLQSRRLDTLIQREGLAVADYPALVMDVQGAELLVLKGAGGLLDKFRYIKAEAADFESYVGCALLKDLDAYVKSFGFAEIRRTSFAKHFEGGQYFDVVWERRGRSPLARLGNLFGKS